MTQTIYIFGIVAIWSWLSSKYDWILFALQSIKDGEQKFDDMDVESVANTLMVLMALFWPITLFIIFVVRNDK